MKSERLNKTNYAILVNDDNLMDFGTESNVFYLEETNEIIKVLNKFYRKQFTINRLKKLAKTKELDNVLTLPTKLLYLDNKFLGYYMNYAGYNLEKYLFYNQLSKDELIDLLLKCKEKLITMHEHGIVHGDIQLRNILLNEEEIKICDINGITFNKFEKGLLNDMTAYLEYFYGYNDNLDILSFNYITDYLLNDYDSSYMRKSFLNYPLYTKDHIKNTVFDENIYNEETSYLKKPKKDKIKAKYLIDYVK